MDRNIHLFSQWDGCKKFKREWISKQQLAINYKNTSYVILYCQFQLLKKAHLQQLKFSGKLAMTVYEYILVKAKISLLA